MNTSSSFSIPERLINSFEKEGVVAFVGAGISMNEGLPSWKELMELMLEEAINDLTAEEINSVAKHLLENNYLLVSDYLKYKIGETRYKDFIEKNFINKKVGQIHELLTSLPISGILTTNYDEILSQSDKQQRFSFPFTWEDPDVFRKTKRPFILHAHGIATNPGSTILSSSDYANLIHNNSNIKFWEAIKNIFQNRKVLFLGYSLNDPDLNLFLAKLKYILPGNVQEHFALIISDTNDALNMYKLRELLGVTPIIINSERQGEATYSWLKELKARVSSKNSVSSEAVFNLTTDASKIASQVDTLKNLFIDFLINQFPDVKVADNTVKTFDSSLHKPFYKDVKNLWSETILRMTEIQLRNFISFLFSIGVTAPIMKRLLSHLP